MREIRINFTDFWPDFIKTNNYFYNLLIQNYKVIIDEINPDLLIYSCYSEEYLKYKCIRIFFTGENVRPDFTACDFAFSFDYKTRKNHFRLPLYSLYIDHHKMLEQLTYEKTRLEAQKKWESKSKFCCMVVSNAKCQKRLDFFENLSKFKKVDSGGKIFNNVGGPVEDKYDFIKDYKFVLSFENSSYIGYTTEKILEPIYKDCIPVYWGNPLISNDFNNKRFIDYNDYDTEEKLINRLIEIDGNDELAIDMILQPPFSEKKITHEQEHIEVLQILIQIIQSNKKPIAIGFWSEIHCLKLFYKGFKMNCLSFYKRVSKKIKLSLPGFF
jgi:hypothetical protein